MERQYYIYIMANRHNTVLYTGITNNLKRRCYEHRACPEHSEGTHQGFTKKYNITKLVYCEIFSDIKSAIMRERQIKGGSRAKKIELVNKLNPEWRDLRDLYDEL